MARQEKAPAAPTAGAETAAPGPRRGGLAVMRRLVVLVGPLAGVMCLGVALGTAGQLCATFLTVEAARAVVRALAFLGGQGSYDGWTGLFTLMLVLAVARGVLHYGEQYCNHYIAFRILAIMRHRVFAALRRLCPAKLEGKDKGDLVSLITSDIELLEVFYAHTISPVAIAALFSVVMVGYLWQISAVAGLVALAGYVVVGVVLPLVLGPRSERTGRELREGMGSLGSFVLESLYGLDELIQYGAGQARLDAMDARARGIAGAQRRASAHEATQRSLTDLAIQGFSLVMLVAMLGQQAGGACDFEGALVAFVAMAGSFGPTSALSSLSSTLGQTIAAGERVLDLLDEEPAVTEVGGRPATSFAGADVRDVSFAYDGGKPVLSHVSATFPKGRVVGIHGPSGSGKSTLLKLLMRFWDVREGKVEVSGRDVRDVNTADLRQMEGYVMQDTWLFHDTIANNIAVGRPGATREEVEEAARKAGLADFLAELPQGLDTNVGELGDGVSDGERQRIGLARAFLHDADLILLDEPTSNLDALNEGLILRSLSEEARGRTVVLVSHRASTMAIADEVLEVDGGRAS